MHVINHNFVHTTRIGKENVYDIISMKIVIEIYPKEDLSNIVTILNVIYPIRQDQDNHDDVEYPADHQQRCVENTRIRNDQMNRDGIVQYLQDEKYRDAPMGQRVINDV